MSSSCFHFARLPLLLAIVANYVQGYDNGNCKTSYGFCSDWCETNYKTELGCVWNPVCRCFVLTGQEPLLASSVQLVKNGQHITHRARLMETQPAIVAAPAAIPAVAAPAATVPDGTEIEKEGDPIDDLGRQEETHRQLEKKSRGLQENASCDCGRIQLSDLWKPNLFPWIVKVVTHWPDGRMDDSCFGSVISREWVLTAAHCVRSDGQTVKSVQIYAPSNQPNETDLKVSHSCNKVVIHPHYRNSSASRSDIAILRLSEPVEFGPNIQPVCVPWGEMVTFDKLWAVKWQWRNEPRITKIPYALGLNPKSSNQCQPIAAEYNDNTEMCAQPEFNDRSCDTGDAGPVLYSEAGVFYAVGINSYGICAASNSPSAVVRVTGYLGWLYRKTAGTKYCNRPG